MGTLTLSRFAKGTNLGNEKPAQAPLAPIAAALAIQAPVPSAKPVETAKQPDAALVQVETMAPAATIQLATATQPEKGNDMGKMEDLKAKRDKLQAELDALDKDYEAVRNEERAGVLAKLRESMAEFGFTADELLGRSPAGRRAGKGVARGPAPVKFKNKDTGETWSGRGQKPRWMTTALAAGKKVEDFAV